MPYVHMPVFEDIAKESAVGFRIRAVEENVRAVNHGRDSNTLSQLLGTGKVLGVGARHVVPLPRPSLREGGFGAPPARFPQKPSLPPVFTLAMHCARFGNVRRRCSARRLGL